MTTAIIAILVCDVIAFALLIWAARRNNITW